MHTDHPFKIALDEFPEDVTSLLLGQPVLKAEPEKTDFLRSSYEYRLDAFLKVTLENQQQCYVHIEFQGKGTKIPMAIRMLNYLALICHHKAQQKLPIYLIVVYVEEGTGSHDTGMHDFGDPSVAQLQYKVIHLWKQDAKAWLETSNPAAFSLIGQTHFDDAQEAKALVSAAFRKLLTFPDREKRIHILLMLLRDKELSKEIEKMAQQYGLMMDTPYIQELISLGREQGIQQGRELAFLEARVQAMLELLRAHIDLPEYDAIAIQHILQKGHINLSEGFRKAATVNNLQEFRTWLDSQQA